MRAKSPRNIACLLALSIALALGGSGIGAASASTSGGTSDPGALALLHQVEAMLKPSTSADLTPLTRRAAPSSAASTQTAPSAPPTDGTPAMVALTHVLPRLNSADQARARAIMGTTTSLSGDICGDGSTTNYTTDTTSDGHFTVYYTTDPTSTDVVTPEYVSDVEAVLQTVYTTEITNMGFTAPRSPSGTTTPIRLCNMSTSLYGYCAPATPQIGVSTAAACTLRNNYDDPDFHNPSIDGPDPLAPLKVTAAHKFFHAVQFAQNAFATTDTPPLWLMEGTAVWMENEVYPNIHDYLQYLPATGIKNPSVPFNITVTSDDFDTNALWPFTVYGNFAFFKFLSGWMRDPGTVKKIWNYLGAHPNAGPMAALNAVLGTHHQTLLRMLLNWSIWNTLPPGSYPNRGLYAPVGWWQVRKLDRTKRTYTSAVANIRPFADAPIRINRGAKVRPGTRLRVVVSGPSYKAGGYYTYRISKTNGSQVTVTRQIGPHGSAFIIPFNGSVSFVAFTLNNTNANHTKPFRISASVL